MVRDPRSSLSPAVLPVEGPAGDDFHHDIARDIGQQVEAMILEAQLEIVFLEDVAGRIRKDHGVMFFFFQIWCVMFLPYVLQSDIIPFLSA